MADFVEKRRLIQERLACTRRDFFSLLSTIKEEDWHKPCGQLNWSVGVQFGHIIESFHPFMRMAVKCARGQRQLLQTPEYLGHPQNHQELERRVAAGEETKLTVAGSFDLAYLEVCKLLGEIRDDEWHLTSYNSNGTWSIEEFFLSLSNHFVMHASAIHEVTAF